MEATVEAAVQVTVEVWMVVVRQLGICTMPLAIPAPGSQPAARSHSTNLRLVVRGGGLEGCSLVESSAASNASTTERGV